jgi:hypothetical protein
LGPVFKPLAGIIMAICGWAFVDGVGDTTTVDQKIAAIPLPTPAGEVQDAVAYNVATLEALKAVAGNQKELSKATADLAEVVDKRVTDLEALVATLQEKCKGATTKATAPAPEGACPCGDNCPCNSGGTPCQCPKASAKATTKAAAPVVPAPIYQGPVYYSAPVSNSVPVSYGSTGSSVRYPVQHTTSYSSTGGTVSYGSTGTAYTTSYGSTGTAHYAPTRANTVSYTTTSTGRQAVTSSVYGGEGRWKNYDGMTPRQHAEVMHGISTAGLTDAQVAAARDHDHDTYGPGHDFGKTMHVQQNIGTCPPGGCPTTGQAVGVQTTGGGLIKRLFGRRG